MTLTTLVSGARASTREAAIHAAIEADLAAQGSLQSTALILEGLSDGKFESTMPPGLDIKRIAPGCFCCIGNLTLRVTLNRILRKPPARLYISIADSTHLPQISAFLSSAPTTPCSN
ncbi:hypothetical protein CAter10_0564 [Collimonas arenae]|uniref:GTPase n=1 Tax=Collimonas arenae TaxID=279058 RepID=UPI00078E76B9|nr:hypothetical protein CAter10_0564 [Collimonas arenae]